MRERGGMVRTAGVLVGIVAALLGGPALAGAAGGESAFVGLAPCRLADTRGNGFGGAFGPPVLAAGVPRDFPLQGQCGIPATALAVSLNVTATDTQGPGFLLLFPQGGTLPPVSTLNYVTGQTVANAALVPLGAGGLTVVAGAAGADLILDVDGYFTDGLVHAVDVDNLFVGPGVGSLVTTGQGNIGVGADALQGNTTGSFNVAMGFQALRSNTTSGENTAVGHDALRNSIDGGGNTAIGSNVLPANTAGAGNTAMGRSAMAENTTGSGNTSIGRNSTLRNTTGSNNTALGFIALFFNTTGSNNVAVGHNAGKNATTGDDNVYIANDGVAAEAQTIRIGSTQTTTFIAGISGVPVGGSQVLVNPNGQLGVPISSARYKEAIEPMGEASREVLRLRPVTFRYRQAAADGTKPRQYGLIAEEVAEVYPELVGRDADGRPQTVLYHVLPALLLNELQRQGRELAAKTRELEELRQRLDGLEHRIAGGK